MSDDNKMVVRYPLGPAPEKGQYREIAPGFQWGRLHLPIRLNHVNVFILGQGSERVLVDCGFSGPEHEQTLSGWFDEAPPSRLLCTHYHPDHFGLAGWLCRRYGTQLLMSEREWLVANLMSRLSDAQANELFGALFERHGMPAERRAEHAERGNTYAQAVTTPPLDYLCLKNGDHVDIDNQSWRVITSGGHSPEQITLYEEKQGWLISADHILPRISPNTSVFAYNPGIDPLGDFLGSFEPYLQLPEDTLTFPCHGDAFTGLHARIHQLVAHHQERLAQCVTLCERPATVTELVPVMFPMQLDKHQEMFAFGELLAHLIYLQRRGQLETQIDPQGVCRFVKK